MAPPISTAIAIDLSRVRHQTVRHLPARGNSNPLADARFRLLNVLQTSLDLDVILDFFVYYHHETLDLDIRVGKQSTHSCGYRLVFTDEYLGEITLKRNRRFSEREMQFIESLIPALLNPLRKSLKSQHGNKF